MLRCLSAEIFGVESFLFPLSKQGLVVKPPETNQTSRKFVEDVQEIPLKICENMGILF